MTEHHGDDDLCASGQAKIDRIYRQLEINLKKPSKLAVCAKWFITIVCSSLLLICVIMSKFAVLELASLMTVDGNCGNTTNELPDLMHKDRHHRDVLSCFRYPNLMKNTNNKTLINCYVQLPTLSSMRSAGTTYN
jgi:hypothetical protein